MLAAELVTTNDETTRNVGGNIGGGVAGAEASVGGNVENGRIRTFKVRGAVPPHRRMFSS